MGFRHRHFTVVGEDVAKAVAGILVGQSRWYELEPWPDDFWCFKVKDENFRALVSDLQDEFTREAVYIGQEY
jgi:hypothetical protein